VDSDFPAAMKSMDQDIPPRTQRVDATANALKEFGYQFSGRQANATFASFGWIKSTAVIFGAANSFVAFCAVVFVLLAARRSRAQLAETLARLDERTQELQQTNHTLQRQQTELRVLFDFIPVMLCFKDTENNVLRVNKRLAEYFGKSVEEVEGKSFREIYPHEASGFYKDDLEIIHSGAAKLGIIEAVRGPKGQELWLQKDKIPVCDQDGKIVGIVVMAQDITERKQAEESLRLLGSAVEQSKESIVITDAALDLPGPKIIFVNPAFTTMTGYTAEEAIGKTPRILQGPRTDKTVLSRLRKNLERGEAFAGEAINYRKDGNEFDLEWQIAPLRNGGGKITHFVAIQHDITGRKRLETQLVQSQKMETIGKLAGGFAHEFNSILTAIIGQSELLIDDLPTGSPLVKNATEINKAAGRAAKLTRQLLAYGRKQFLQPEILNLNRVIVGMEGMFHHLMGGDVDTQIIPALDLHAVMADAGQIEQVIMNMVINARDAMPNGGKLTLETANVTFDQENVGRYPEVKPGNYALLAITDTGTGISEAVKVHVFEPFFSTKGVGQGTGLGLSTCYGIIKQSGGHISIYSEPGRGTTFKIYLPQVEQQTKISVQRLDSPNLPRGTETILLVEDDPALREMAATLLRRLGYTVLAAANGIEALSVKQEQSTGHIDLLFTDVVMPHMSGKELADRVRALYPHTRILFTSAYTENAIVHQGVLNQGVALLQKPFTPSALAHKVREVLDQPGVPKPDAAQKTFGFTKITDEAAS
jgi:PAS domain S-box-containing protein